MLTKAQSEERMKTISAEENSYLKVKYIAMHLLISHLDKKNLMLKNIKKCDDETGPNTDLSRDLKEKLAWIVSLITIQEVHLKLTNTLIKEVLDTFRLRKIKEDQKSEEKEDDKKKLYDLGDNYIKCIQDSEVNCY